MARFLFATDLHANAESYGALAEAARDRRADAVVLGGDLFPMTKPMPYAQLDWGESFFRPWLEGLRGGPRVFAILGNDDVAPVGEEMERWDREGLVAYVHGKRVEFVAGLRIFGYNCVPVTPFSLKDWERFDVGTQPFLPATAPLRVTRRGAELIGDWRGELGRRPTIEDDLRGLPADGWDRTVVVTHSPPHATHLDRLFDGAPVGSRAVRAFIERVRPLMTLHGHIHESPQMSGRIDDRIGGTPGYNPGASNRGLKALVAQSDGAEWEVKPL